MKTLFLAAGLLLAEEDSLFRFEAPLKTEYGRPHFSPDGKTVAVGKTLWDLPAQRQIGVLDVPLIAVSNEGSLGVSASEDHVNVKERNGNPYKGQADSQLTLWNLKNGKKQKLAEYRFDCIPSRMGFCPKIDASFSPDGKRLAFNVPPREAPWGSYLEGALTEFRRDVWQAYAMDLDGKPRKLPGQYAAFIPDGRLLVIKFADSKPQQIIDGDTGQTVAFLRNAMTAPFTLTFTGNGKRLVATRYHSRKLDDAEMLSEGVTLMMHHHLQVWSTETGELLHDKEENIRGDAWAAGDGRWLIEQYFEKGADAWRKVRAFDLNHGGKFLAFPDPQKKILSVSPDGQWVAVQGDKFVTEFLRLRWDGAAPPPTSKPVPATNVDAPPSVKLPLDPNAYAVVIGVEKYREPGIPKVDFAARDAATVHRYLTESLGFDAANVVLLQDERATKTDLEKHLGAWLKNRVNEKSRVFVYYAGHGAPNPATGQGFLIPYEGDPNYTEETAYPIQALYDTLGKLPAKDVTVVLDACFSGSGGRSLLAKGARPLVTQAKATAAGNTSVISAASGAQISASYPQGRHGLLTYFLLEGLHGAADADKDGAVTTSELFAYARPAVEREARKQNLEQTPTMTGSGATIWLKK